MRYTAISSVGDALDVTREYLLGRGLRGWLTLALMAVFLGPTGVSGPPGPIHIQEEFQEGVNGELPDIGAVLELISVELLIIVFAVVGMLVASYALVSSFMEFAFVHSLSQKTAAIRQPARTYWKQAGSLFLFRLVVWTLVVGSGALLLVAFFASDVLGDIIIIEPMVYYPLLLVGFVLGYLLNRFTIDFVVPIMLADREGIVKGWRSFLTVFQQSWRAYVIYLPVRIILEVVLGIAFSIAYALYLVAIGVVIGLPLGIILGLTVGWYGLALVLAILVVLALVGLAGLLVPFHTYLRYYTLLVLGDTDRQYDLIAELRWQVRNDSAIF